MKLHLGQLSGGEIFSVELIPEIHQGSVARDFEDPSDPLEIVIRQAAAILTVGVSIVGRQLRGLSRDSLRLLDHDLIVGSPNGHAAPHGRTAPPAHGHAWEPLRLLRELGGTRPAAGVAPAATVF